MKTPLSSVDPAIAQLIHLETERQQNCINFIASENYVSTAVRDATGSVLTNKYAEGYPGHRYYAGCEIIDQVESLAITRCQKLFEASYVNVQPHSGSSANLAAYCALLKPGDAILGMSLAHGGHLTHGHAVNISGTWFKSYSYGVDKDTEQLNYEDIERLAHEYKPKLIIAGASAYSRIIDFERFAQIAQAVGAYLVADIAHIAGLIAAGLHPSPINAADIVTSTTHKTLRGPRGGLMMSGKATTHTGASLADALNRAIMPGSQGGPLMHSIAAKAVCFHEALTTSFVDYQKKVIATCRYMAEKFQERGYRIVSGGTDNHLFVVDLRSTQHTGLTAQNMLELNGITTSRSCIPNDPRKPWVTSGLRFGTAAMCTRGLENEHVDVLVDIIDTLLQQTDVQTYPHYEAKIHQLAQDLRIP
jgi:glycine hydroxymethyltransferase